MITSVHFYSYSAFNIVRKQETRCRFRSVMNKPEAAVVRKDVRRQREEETTKNSPTQKKKKKKKHLFVTHQLQHTEILLPRIPVC